MGGDAGRNSDSPADRLAAASNILLSASTLNPAETDACMAVLQWTATDGMNVLAVTYDRAPPRWLSDFRTHVTDDPDWLRIISVNETPRGVARIADRSVLADERQVGLVESPRDLTGLGIQITECLHSIGDGTGDDGTPGSVLCFDSVTALLRLFDLQQAFRFLHVLTQQVASLGVTAHYHVHPDAVGDRELQTIQPLFDALVTVNDDGVEDAVLR